MYIEDKNLSFMQKYTFTFISLFVLALIAIPLFLLSKKAQHTPQIGVVTQPIISVTPPPPLTSSNVEPTLTAQDSQLQQTLDQADSDMKAADAIDSSQDSVQGL